MISPSTPIRFATWPPQYPTDSCNSNPANLDCFTKAILSAKAQSVRPAAQQQQHQQQRDHTNQTKTAVPFLITEYSCGWKNSAIHGGESTAYAASFALRTVSSLAGAGLEALSWWTFSMLFDEDSGGVVNHDPVAGNEFGQVSPYPPLH